MRSVSISDDAFGRLERCASALGLTAEDYLEDLIYQDTARQGSGPVTLSPESLERVRQGLVDVRAGRIFSREQVREHLQATHDEWVRTHPS